MVFADVPARLTANGTEFGVILFTETRQAEIISEVIRDAENLRLKA